MDLFNLNARLRTISSARKELATKGVVENLISKLQIVMAAEMVAENWLACTQHSQFIAKVLQPADGEPPQLREATRHAFLHMDVERAIATGTRPLLDLSTWYYERHALDTWSSELLLDPSVNSFSLDDLDRLAIGDPTLNSLFAEIRYLDHLLRHPTTATELSQATAFQLSTAIDILNGKLLSFSIPIIETVSVEAHELRPSHFDSFYDVPSGSAMLDMPALTNTVPNKLQISEQTSPKTASTSTPSSVGLITTTIQSATTPYLDPGPLSPTPSTSPDAITSTTTHTTLSHLHATQSAAAALAALYYLRLRTRQEYAGPLHPVPEPQLMEWFCAQAPRLHMRMQTLLESSEEALRALLILHHSTSTTKGAGANTTTTPPTAKTLHPVLRLRLWILHIGSVMEETADFGAVGLQRPPDYHRRAMRELLALTGLDRDQDQDQDQQEIRGGEGGVQVVEEILARFLCFGGGEKQKHKPKHKQPPLDVYGPRWLSPVLRTWGLTNWNGEVVV
ncbi:uncharacterized protein HMPREF1541_03009 [Cyphellophora europaea CBS 101466]|uniref:Uncharacterized protein n=1 Tax=Cyphellophora europaea (strain CBS 101466) TaxID=1220924 RepID=W2RZG8_CYPE1|nr:uncharacterized protein HMPREF1541_03009 [Cyphellophora europaea CBS 101466]ETN41074.1 hypothetical protein HMPREF1541_03009 [Cyphellophora europaea CBS 101466]